MLLDLFRFERADLERCFRLRDFCFFLGEGERRATEVFLAFAEVLPTSKPPASAAGEKPPSAVCGAVDAAVGPLDVGGCNGGPSVVVLAATLLRIKRFASATAAASDKSAALGAAGSSGENACESCNAGVAPAEAGAGV